MLVARTTLARNAGRFSAMRALGSRMLSDGIHDDFKPKVKKSYSNESDGVHAQIAEDVAAHKVVVFMKGIPEQPQCGFSNAVVQVMKAEGVEFKGFNVLADMDLREGIKSYSAWPTIPQVRGTANNAATLRLSRARSRPKFIRTQVYVGGEFIGGCDTTIEMYKSGELRTLLKEVGAVSD